jgi:hypothetical protein
MGIFKHFGYIGYKSKVRNICSIIFHVFTSKASSLHGLILMCTPLVNRYDFIGISVVMIRSGKIANNSYRINARCIVYVPKITCNIIIVLAVAGVSLNSKIKLVSTVSRSEPSVNRKFIGSWTVDP